MQSVPKGWIGTPGITGQQSDGAEKRGIMKYRVFWQKLLRVAGDDRGSELVEFAIASWLMMVLLIGAFQWMIAMYAYHFASYAAQQGARFAEVRGYTWSKNETTNCSTSAPPSFTMPYDCTASSTDIQNYVQSLASPGIIASDVTIDTTSSYLWPGKTPDGTTSTCSPANSQGCLVKVTVNYTFNFVPFLNLTSLPISATAEKPILQ